MKFTAPRFLTALGITFIVGIVLVALLRALGILPSGAAPDDPAALAKEAETALEAVKNREPGDRRPASYDAILLPLDKLVEQTKTLLESETYNPAADYEKVRALALPVIDVATRADEAAKTETSFLAKDYRFNDQKGEASQYLANALWERILANQPQRDGVFTESASYPPREMEELRGILDTGIAAAPENAELYYIRGVVNRAEGLFVPASRDLGEAVAINPEKSAAWNVLGLVWIHLQEFDKAEEAMERALSLEQKIAEAAQTRPGGEYTAIVYNLALFHESLATFYSREYRMTPTVESQALMRRHADGARKYLEEFLKYEPSGSADAALARAKLDALP